MSTEAENRKHAINDTTQADHKYRINELELRSRKHKVMPPNLIVLHA